MSHCMGSFLYAKIVFFSLFCHPSYLPSYYLQVLSTLSLTVHNLLIHPRCQEILSLLTPAFINSHDFSFTCDSYPWISRCVMSVVNPCSCRNVKFTVCMYTVVCGTYKSRDIIRSNFEKQSYQEFKARHIDIDPCSGVVNEYTKVNCYENEI